MINKPEGDIRDVNFWELNPNYKILFDKLYDTDKSKAKIESSRIMWALYLILHPSSEFYNLPDKRNLTKDKFLKNPKFKWEDYKSDEDLFKDVGLTQAQRSLFDWNELMKQRMDYLKSQTYFFDYIDKQGKLVKGTAEQLDRAFSATPKMYADYDKIVTSMKEEEYQMGKGKKILSLTDAGEI